MSDQSTADDRNERTRAVSHLYESLEAEEQCETDFHIREALQLLTIADGQQPTQ